VIGVESESDSEEDKRRKRKKSAKEEVRTRKVCFEDERKRKKNRQENVDELTRKLLRLNVKDDAYVATYVQLFVLAPEIMDNFPPPSCFGASTVTATSTTMTPTYPRHPQSQPSVPMPHYFSYHFCKKLECCLRICPTAAKYVWLGQACQDANSELELSLYSLSALDKENSLESSLYWSIYLYIIYLVCTPVIPHSQPNYV